MCFFPGRHSKLIIDQGNTRETGQSVPFRMNKLTEGEAFPSSIRAFCSDELQQIHRWLWHHQDWNLGTLDHKATQECHLGEMSRSVKGYREVEANPS